MRRSHVALLRGVNIGGSNRVPMPALREAVQSLGHHDVVTYIQSGNVVFTAGKGAPNETLSEALAASIAERTGVKAEVIVLQATELARVIRKNPFPEAGDDRLLHAVFLREPPGAAGRASVAAAVARAEEKGSRDDARVVGRTLYLWTPDGFARSVLRAELDRSGAKRTPMRDGTARNWATVNALHTLVGH